MNQQGITLIITVLMMTIMLSIVTGVSTILLRQVNIIGNAQHAIVAQAAAESGLEKTQYIAKFQAGRGGLCSLCQACSPDQCKNCQVVLTTAGCSVSYDSSIDGATYQVHANMSSGVANITSKGFYRNAARQVTATK